MENQLFIAFPNSESWVRWLSWLFIKKFKKIKVRDIFRAHPGKNRVHEKLIHPIQLYQIQMQLQWSEDKLFKTVVDVSVHRVKKLLLGNPRNCSQSSNNERENHNCPQLGTIQKGLPCEILPQHQLQSEEGQFLQLH